MLSGELFLWITTTPQHFLLFFAFAYFALVIFNLYFLTPQSHFYVCENALCLLHAYTCLFQFFLSFFGGGNGILVPTQIFM
jgi:hypothetical protein